METLSYGELTTSNDLLNNPEAIGRRLRADGYLFLRELLPREGVLDLRRAVLKLCADAGWLRQGTDPIEGLTDHEPVMEGDPEHIAVYERIQSMESFHLLAHQPAVARVMEACFEEPVFCHPNKICRTAFPRDNARATPPHQDYLYIQGSTDTLTCWAPLGDLPHEYGGLMIQAGTHKAGFFIPHKHPGVGGHAIPVDESKPWLTTEFRAGDVFIFNSLTVHSAKPNTTPDRMRISMDFRYTGLSHAVSESNRLPHFHWAGGKLGSWDTLDGDWRTFPRRYWEDLPVQWQPHDSRLIKFAELDE